jgi:hypothetical protein
MAGTVFAMLRRAEIRPAMLNSMISEQNKKVHL